ncbi:NACHT domain-containing protein [Porphyromonas catoniae]|uniref:NACHT domain-containing protein n=1 Tax=Porphyromonas catoniae TaxID=41976 RepID=UPI0023F4D27E|nr:NACHT domain-containing protein [Porphyromonas catoniae]
MDEKAIVTLFAQYNYKQNIKLSEPSRVLVFTLKAAYPAVEIILLDDKAEENANRLKTEYSGSGYAAHVCKEKTIDALEDYLFNLFFDVDRENQRTQRKYSCYIEDLMSIYSIYGKSAKDYSYISIPYQVEKDFTTRQATENLISSILDVIDQDGPQFVIIEAAAGFGKTSTAYELLNEYIERGSKNRPFLMELSKDRRASSFRYLLLSQIDQNFVHTLKADIVIRNIKRGKIPLIIDGFDELLSKDLDNGTQDARFEDVETMLSTIGDLLTENSKVILTTRRTAIFSGESFFAWYANLYERSPFMVSRYQLENPSINDWLTKQDLAKQSIHEEDLYHVANPVLLAYLRYCSPKIESVEELIREYFRLLLKREVKRQEIPFSIEEQMEIYQKLSTYFSGFNITTERRGEIKLAIAEYATPLLNKHGEENDDKEKIVNALTNHALLDRKGEKVGFLNDFVLGYLLMEAFVNYQDDPDMKVYLSETSFSFIDKSLIVAKSRKEDNRKKFWEVLQGHPSITQEQVTRADLLLMGETRHEVDSQSFTSERFCCYKIGTEEGPLRRCTFSSVEFTSCTFNLQLMEDCFFINCRFIDCNFHGESRGKVQFWECTFNKEYDHIEESKNLSIQEDQPVDSLDNSSEGRWLYLQILSKYFMVDKKTRKMCLISRLRQEVDLDDKSLRKGINYLKTNGMIVVNGDKSFITDEGIRFIKEAGGWE